MQREPIADWELDKAKNSSRRSSIQALQSSLGMAVRLTQYAVFQNDPGLINSQFEKIAAVTKQDVQRVANKSSRLQIGLLRLRAAAKAHPCDRHNYANSAV